LSIGNIKVKNPSFICAPTSEAILIVFGETAVIKIKKKEVKKMKKMLIPLASLLLIILIAAGCQVLPAPEPPEPLIEDATPTLEDLSEITLTAQQLEGQGGPDSALIIATHTLQARYELLFNKLNASMDNEEIPFLTDVLQATLLDYIDSLEAQGTPGAAIVRGAAERGLQELASAKQKVDEALVEFVVTLGEPPDEIRDVAVVIPPELLNSISEEIGMPSERLQELLGRIPTGERLTVVASSGILIVDPSGNFFPQPKLSWWHLTWWKVKGVAKGALSRAVLFVKLGNLLFKYGWAILDCYYDHFPDWKAIEDCLVNEHGLAKDIVTRILNLIKDP
jgi:hypothetical protein